MKTKFISFCVLLAACLLVCCSAPKKTKIEQYAAAFLDGRDSSDFPNYYNAEFEKYMTDFIAHPENLNDIEFKCIDMFQNIMNSPRQKYEFLFFFSVEDTLAGCRFRIVDFSGIKWNNSGKEKVKYFASDTAVLFGAFDFKDLKIEIIK